jgi:hypothetical protein
MRMDDTEPPGGWGLRIGDFIKAYPDHVIRGGFDGFGWTAQAKDSHGRPRGPIVADLSLDALAAKIRAQKNRAAG